MPRLPASGVKLADERRESGHCTHSGVVFGSLDPAGKMI
jgi:hypothetical protein